MSWDIERHGRVAVVTMNTNQVNAQNQAFFDDLHEAFDTLERDHPDAPVVLTGRDGRFSAGLDLDHHFALFSEGRDAVAEWFPIYRATNMRLFTYPRPVIAAVNGHTYAGGLVTAGMCDYRVCVDAGAGLALNEVAIGIPMPAVYMRMLAYAWGEPTAARVGLFAEIFTPQQAFELGIVNELQPAEKVLERAIEMAGRLPDDCLESYAFTKRACQASALRDVSDLCDPADQDEAPDVFTHEQSLRAHRRYYAQLKGRAAPW